MCISVLGYMHVDFVHFLSCFLLDGCLMWMSQHIVEVHWFLKMCSWQASYWYLKLIRPCCCSFWLEFSWNVCPVLILNKGIFTCKYLLLDGKTHLLQCLMFFFVCSFGCHVYDHDAVLTKVFCWDLRTLSVLQQSQNVQEMSGHCTGCKKKKKKPMLAADRLHSDLVQSWRLFEWEGNLVLDGQ